jgi:hypothetical protein
MIFLLKINLMTIDYTTLDALRNHHPAWKLLNSPHAPLVASFLHRVFVIPNVRVMAATDLAENLEDELFTLRERLGHDAFPKPAMDYLNDWAGPDKGWLRKFYRQGSDEPQFDLTPSTEKAIAWLGSLFERSFVGTESRLLTLFELLKQMSEGSETDPSKRIAELHKRRNEIDVEISRVLAGEVALLDDTALKDRFQQFTQLARELLTDFREVEHNFRLLDRRVRERIALWAGSKGELLEDIMGERDAIADSDQGRSFQAFWDFLMSSSRQEELTHRLEQILKLSAVHELKPDARMRRVHHDWLEAGEHTQRTVALLSQQLRRFLDDKAWIENRRIMDILRNVETRALAVKSAMPTGEFTDMCDMAVEIELPMERPLAAATIKHQITHPLLELDETTIDASALYAQVIVDKAQLKQHIRQSLQERSQITLKELIELYPLTHGLAELVLYLQLGSESVKTQTDEAIVDLIIWEGLNTDQRLVTRHAHLPRMIFVR